MFLQLASRGTGQLHALVQNFVLQQQVQQHPLLLKALQVKALLQANSLSQVMACLCVTCTPICELPETRLCLTAQAAVAACSHISKV